MKNFKSQQPMENMAPEAAEALQITIDNFSTFMQREIQEGDRIQYWSYCYSSDELKKEIILSMIRANILERHIYVYEKPALLLIKKALRNSLRQIKKKSMMLYESTKD